MDLIAYAPQSKVLTSTGTAVSTLLPLDQNSGYPKEVRITATAPCYVELGDIGVTAVVGDALVQPRDPLVVATCGARSISVISVSGTASITVTALESGSVQSALTNPSLSLDMLSGVLSSAVTFTRASSGTYFDSTGRLVTASNDVARFDYDPATLLPRGLLIEEQRTNLLLHSRDMTQAAWSKTDVTPTRNQVGIDGTANSACLMTEGSAGTAITAQDGAAVTAGATISDSIVIKRGNTDWVRVGLYGGGFTNYVMAWFNLGTGAKGAVSNIGTATGGASTITNLGGGWYRLTVSGTPDTAYTVPKIGFCSAAADGSTTRVSGATYIVDAAQLEVGSFATSIITTGASTVTRAADSAVMTGTNFSGWYNQTQGTFVVEHDYIANPNADSQVFAATDAAVANMLGARRPGSGQQTILQRTPTNIDIILAAATANAVTKIANSYDGTGTSGVLNGTAVVTAGAWTPNNLDRIFLGHRNAVSQLNGHIRRLNYYPTRLSSATLQALTS